MKKTVLSKLVGKQVEVFLQPDMPVTSGVLISCDDDFIVLEDGVWSYEAILGIRVARDDKHRISAPASTATSVPVTGDKTAENKEAKPDTGTESAQQDTNSEKTSASTAKDTLSEKDTPSTADSGAATGAATGTAADHDVSVKKKKPQVEIKIPDREFAGVLTKFYYDHRRWGFIESPEVTKAGVPLRDGSKVFVHINQIEDNTLRKWLLTEKPEEPNVDVMFRLTVNQQGVAADEVRKVEHVKLGEILTLTGPNTAGTAVTPSTSSTAPSATSTTASSASSVSSASSDTDEKKSVTSAEEKTEVAEENSATTDEKNTAVEPEAAVAEDKGIDDSEAPAKEIGEIDYYCQRRFQFDRKRR